MNHVAGVSILCLYKQVTDTPAILLSVYMHLKVRINTAKVYSPRLYDLSYWAKGNYGEVILEFGQTILLEISFCRSGAQRYNHI